MPVRGYLADLIPCIPAESITPGYRNEFHAGSNRRSAVTLSSSGEYIWKYTHNGYDFSVLGSTPITFPIQWAQVQDPWICSPRERAQFSRLDGVQSSCPASQHASSLRRSLEPALIPRPRRAFFALTTTSSFNQTTHMQYQPRKNGPWVGFTWRYDSGLVAGATPCFGLEATNTCPGSIIIGGVEYVSMVASNVGSIPLSADQEFEAGFTCNGVHATPTVPLPFNCPASTVRVNAHKSTGAEQRK